MTDSWNNPAFPLGGTIEAFAERKGWPERPELIGRVEKISRLGVEVRFVGQTFRVYIDGFEDRRTFSLFIYFPFRVRAEKYVDTCLLFNYINDEYQYHGRLSADGDGAIRYKDFMDAGGLVTDVAMLENMMHCATALLENQLDAVAAVALTGKDFEEARQELEQKYKDTPWL